MVMSFMGQVTLAAPQLRQLDAHLGGATHVLDADPFVRSVDVLHPGEQIRRRHAPLGEARPVGPAPDGLREVLDASPATRLARQFDRAHVVLQPVAHVAVLLGDGARDPGARLGGLNRRADLLDQRATVAQALPLEVAEDEVEIGRGRRAAHLVHVDEPLAAGRRLRRQRDMRQGVDDLGGQVQRVDQLVLGMARMDGDALHVHRRLVGRERLVDDLAPLGAVQRIREPGVQVLRQIGMDAAADLFIRREGDANRTVGQFRMLQQVAGRRHHDGHARLVVCAEQRRPAGGDDVVAHPCGQVGELRGRQHDVGVGQHDVAPGIGAMDDRRDAGAGELRRRVHVRHEGDGRRVGLHRRWNRGQDRAVVGQRHVGGADGRQFATSSLSRSNCFSVLGDVVDFSSAWVSMRT